MKQFRFLARSTERLFRRGSAVFGRRGAFRSFVLAATAAATAAAAALSPAHAQQILRDAEIEAWLDDYSRPIFEAAGLEPDSIDILLLAGPPNAFAGGSTMGVFTGLITTADTPNQIEGVIAHEAGHIALAHSVRSAEAYAAATRPILLSLVLAAGAIAAGAPEAGIGLLGLGQTIGIANALVYSRGQESAADQAAVSYLNKLGHSSQGLIEFFSKLRNYQVLTSRRVNPYLQTHPLANARVTALTERITASSYRDVKDSAEEIHRLNMMQAKIHGFLQEAHVTLRQYPLKDQSDPARYARAVAYYRSADIEKALSEIDFLIETHPENQYFHELKGQMLFEFGRVREAIAPHAESVDLDPGEALFKINLGRAIIGVEDQAIMPDAVKELKAALAIERDNSFAWFELARAYGYMGEEALANLATAESRYHAGAKPAAVQFARRAMAGLDRNSIEWRQAADIIFAVAGDVDLRAQPSAGGGRRRPQQRRAPRAGSPRSETTVPDPTPDPAPDPAQDPAPTEPEDVPDPETKEPA